MIERAPHMLAAPKGLSNGLFSDLLSAIFGAIWQKEIQIVGNFNLASKMGGGGSQAHIFGLLKQGAKEAVLTAVMSCKTYLALCCCFRRSPLDHQQKGWDRARRVSLVTSLVL